MFRIKNAFIENKYKTGGEQALRTFYVKFKV